MPLPQVFSDDEDLVRDTTAVQLAGGRDIQGIPWELTQYTRDGYRVRIAPKGCGSGSSGGQEAWCVWGACGVWWGVVGWGGGRAGGPARPLATEAVCSPVSNGTEPMRFRAYELCGLGGRTIATRAPRAAPCCTARRL